MPDDIRVGLVGFGHGGAIFHAPLIASTPGLALAAVMTRDAGRQALVRTRYPMARVVTDVGDMLAGSRRVDVLVVASPNRHHAEHAHAALAAGVDVVVDKPLARSVAEARALVSAAAAQGRFLTVFQNRRWDGDFVTLRRLCADGTLGPVIRFESRFERWRPKPRDTWRERGGEGDAGGLLFDLGSHLVDQALQLFGPVADVYAEVDRRRPGASIDDDVFIALTHANGVRAHLWTSQLAAVAGPRFVARGTKATFVKYGLDGQEEALKAGGIPSGTGWGVEGSATWGHVDDGASRRVVETAAGDYGAFYRSVVLAARRRADVPVNPWDAIAVLEIIEAAQRSHDAGRVVWVGRD